MILDKLGSIFEDRRKDSRRKENIPVETERRKKERREESKKK